MKPWSNFDVLDKRGPVTKGRVVDLSPGRFCGIIRASDGQQVFFHGRDCEDGAYNKVKVGKSVQFELITDHVSGARAAKIRPATTRTR